MSQDPLRLSGAMPTFHSYVSDANVGVDPMGLAGAVKAFLTVGDKEFVAKSKETILKDGPFKDLVESIKKNLEIQGLGEDFHGMCGEIRAIRDALEDGISLDQLKGAKMTAILKKTGEIKKACDCCKEVMDKLGIEEVRCPK